MRERTERLTQRLCLKLSLISSLSLCLSLSGCIDPVVGGVGTEQSDDVGSDPYNTAGNQFAGAQAGSTIPTSAGTGTSGGEQPTAGTQSSGELSGDELPDRCISGTSLGLCLECGPNSTQIVPENDPACAPIDCEFFK